MTEAPDFTAPVLGYRAWDVRADGTLYPWSATAAGPWRPGLNTARCLNSLGEPSAHRPPGPRCSCGIYGLTDVTDGRLLEHLGPHGAIGAVAAWGEMEVHHGGFRAELACVLALAEPPDLSRFRRGRLQRAADAYGVPLVPYAELEAVARLDASPLPADLVAPDDDAGGPAPSRGIDPDWHVWAQPGDGLVRVGITTPLAREVALADVATPDRFTPGEPDSPVRGRSPETGPAPLAAGCAVDVGDVLLELPASGGAIAVLSPIAGRVALVNADPGSLLSDPLETGWLVAIEPADWVRDAAGLQWGPAAAVAYRAALRTVGRDAFAEIRVRTLAGRPRLRDWRDVKAAVAGLGSEPRFADGAQVDRVIGDALFEALSCTVDLHPRLRRLDLVVRFRLHAPAAVLVLDLRPDAMRLRRHDVAHADVTVTMSAADADDYWRGRLDLAAAVRSGAARIDGSRDRLLLAASVWKRLHARYAEARGPLAARRAA